MTSTSGVPLYLQLIEQIKLQIESGIVRAGEQLPSVRKMAEDSMINPNTVVRAYRDLDQQGVIELRQGTGAFVCDVIVPRAKLMQKAQSVVEAAVDRLEGLKLSEDEIRRLVEADLARRRTAKSTRKRFG